jgi:hypothetical protein
LIGGKVIGCHVSFVLAMKNDIEPNPNKKKYMGDNTDVVRFSRLSNLFSYENPQLLAPIL